MKLFKKGLAEFLGTGILVFAACGVAIATRTLETGFGLVAVSLAFGLTLTAIAYTLGPISGGHVNPAVSLGVLLKNAFLPKDKRDFTFKEFIVYVLAQILGAFVACLPLRGIFGKDCGFGANTIQPLIASADLAELRAVSIEVALTFIFVLVVLVVSSNKKLSRIGGVVIGSSLALVHFLGFTVTGTSVNPARSLGPALFSLIYGNSEPLSQVWIFIVGPLIGTAIAALVYYFFHIRGAKEETCECHAHGGLTSDEVRTIVREELEATLSSLATVIEDDGEEHPTRTAAPVEEAPAEEPVEEKPTEEPVAEEPVEEPVAETVVEESAEESEESSEESGNATKLARARQSFEERIENLDPASKAKYKELKEYCLSYGLHERMSNAYDTFRLHKVRYVVFAIAGKGLKLHFNLSIADYENSPISVKDDSAKTKYADVPVMFKVKSDLSLKRAKALIDDTMAKAGISKK